MSAGAGDEVTVVWVAADGGASEGARAGPGDGRDDASRALGEWASARALRRIAPIEGSGRAMPKIDPTIADRVEKELARAREATAAVDADAAERSLARAEALLRDHPEQPYAAWLRAEVHRGWAARWARLDPRDGQRAQAAWQEADALDGGRAAGVGELAFPSRFRVGVTLSLLGTPSRRTVTLLDGVELTGTTSAEGMTTYAIDVPPAEHQLVVSLDGEAVFASWISIAEARVGSPRVDISIRVADDGACTASSFGGVTRDGDRVRAPGVTCRQWVAAVPGERRGAVLVARCERSSCGPLLEWRSERGLEAPSAPPPPPRSAPWPTWATWTAVGVGAVAATGLTLFASGVFESRPTEPRIVAGGARVE